MKVLARGGRSRALAAIAVLATIALVAAGASPAEAVPIKRGHTTLVLDPNIFDDLDPLGIGILPIAPAEAVSGGERFPISGGRVSRNGLTARIKHDGGLAFVGDNAQVKVKRLKVNLNTDESELIASLDGQRISFLSLEGGRQTSRGRHAHLPRDRRVADPQGGEGAQPGVRNRRLPKGHAARQAAHPHDAGPLARPTPAGPGPRERSSAASRPGAGLTGHAASGWKQLHLVPP